MEYTVSEDIQILALLRQLFPDSSMSTLRSWIKAGRVVVDGKTVAKGSEMALKNAIVHIGPKVSFLRQGIKVLFEDDSLIVIEKPAGLLSVATDFDTSSSVHAILKKRFHKQRVFPVHRLDRDTSGVMLFAYSDHARRQLKRQFEEHTVEKVYYAIVEGHPATATGTWESYLVEDERYFVSSSGQEGQGKRAVTHFETVSANKRYALLRLCPVTGKKHQLRVHCKEAQLPIVGDKRYNSGSDPLERLCLHAQEISFVHPVTNKKMSFEVPIPSAFNKLIAVGVSYVSQS